MSGKIVLSPEVLTAQSNEMRALMNEYESLFASVTSLLEDVNNNWSANLANNFSSKITSAQSSFASIVDMLGWGAEAALNSATTMESVDSALAQMMNGDSGTTVISSDDGSVLEAAIDQTIADTAQNWESVSDMATWLNENYDELPDEVKSLLKQTLGEENVSVVEVLSEVLSGNADFDTLASGLELVGVESAGKLVSAAKQAYTTATTNENMQALQSGLAFYVDQFVQDMGNENYSSALSNLGSAVLAFDYTVLYGTVDALTELTASGFETASNIAISISEFASSVFSDSMSPEVSDAVSSAIDTVQTGCDYIVSWFRDIL